MCGGLPALVRIAWGWYNIVSTRGLLLGFGGFRFWCAVCAGFRVGFVCCVYSAGCWWLAYFAVVVGVNSGVGGFGRFWSI